MADGTALLACAGSAVTQTGWRGGGTDARSQIQISESARAGYVCGLSFFCMGSFSF